MVTLFLLFDDLLSRVDEIAPKVCAADISFMSSMLVHAGKRHEVPRVFIELL